MVTRLLATIALVALSTPALADEPRLAVVLPLSSYGQRIDHNESVAVEESIRLVAVKFLRPMGYKLLTSENTLALLQDNGVDPDKVCEASCALAAARELKASLFISSTITGGAKNLRTIVRLYESRSGSLLDSVIVDGADADDLRLSFEQVAPLLFDSLVQERDDKLKQEARSRNRKLTLVFGGLTAAAVGSSIYGYTSATTARDALRAQVLPVNTAVRDGLIVDGNRGNTIGLVGVLAAVALTIPTVAFLSGSF